MTELSDKFSYEEIEWRIQQAGGFGSRPWGIVLPYLTSRAIMDRLDEVVGVENWKDEYEFIGNNVLCRLSLRYKDEWITKADVSEMTNIEPAKGAVSGAIKRAGVKFGIGRYLYGFKGPFFVELHAEKIQGGHSHYDKETKKKYWWVEPKVEGMYSDE